MDNITNKATGLTKEMLDMTYPDKYYNDVINPAKLGQGPIPSKTQMMYQNLKSGGPFKAMRIGMDPYLPSFMGGGKYNAERAMPTGPAKAALGGFGTAARTAFSLPMTAGALAQQGLYSLNKPSTPAGFNYAQNLDRNSISSIADETAGLDYQQDYMQGVMDADKNYTGITGAEQTKSPIAENDLTNYNEHYNMMPEEEKGGIIEYLKNKGSQIKDFAMPALKDAAGRTIASQTLGTAGAMFSPYLGLAGMIFGGLKGGNMFNQPYRSGMNTVDEFGNLISAEDLDKQNALGGYYTDAARASRNRAKSIATFKARGGASTPAGIDRLNKLKAEQKLEETSRQNAFDNAMASGQSFYDNLNQGQGSTAGGVGNTAAQAAESRATAGDDPSYSGPSTFQYGGRAGYRDGGYSSQDNEEQQAQDQASFDAGNRTDDYNDMYSGDNNNSVNNINIPTGTSNLDFSMVKDINPAFSYANNVGRFGGMLDTTKTIEEEEPVGTVGYFSPSGNFGIGYDTNLGRVGNANLGNLNIGYTGQDGFNANYMGGFAGDAGRFGANYGKDGLEARMTYNKKFNNGGIVGMYR